MAKISSVRFKSIPEIINVGDDINDISILIDIEFHALDISNKMEYLLHLFVYDVHGDIDIPVIISNWDDSTVLGVSQDGRNDDFLGKETVFVKANSSKKSLELPMALRLGQLAYYNSPVSRKFEVFATLIPAVSRVSKWSEPIEAQLLH